MIITIMIISICLGYLAIALEHPIKIDKALIGGFCFNNWRIIDFGGKFNAFSGNHHNPKKKYLN